MARLPELDPVLNPNTGVMTTAVPKGFVQGLPKMAPVPQTAPVAVGDGLAPPPPPGFVVNQKPVPSVLPTSNALPVTGTTPPPPPGFVLDQTSLLPQQPLTPTPAPAPTLQEPGFIQKSVDAWKVGWSQYAQNKLYGISAVTPGTWATNG